MTMKIKTYSDKESKELTKKYDLSRYQGVEKPIPSTLGCFEREEAARLLLLLDRKRIVGIAKKDLERLLDKNSCSNFNGIIPYPFEPAKNTLNSFLKQGYLREVPYSKNKIVLYPTQQLLENQKVPLSLQE